jgi:hypothetical protein
MRTEAVNQLNPSMANFLILLCISLIVMQNIMIFRLYQEDIWIEHISLRNLFMTTFILLEIFGKYTKIFLFLKKNGSTVAKYTPKERVMRIGIIGAGAAGLAFAHAAARAGHTDITVLEQSERVGGKCCTFYHNDRSYELGAGALTTSYIHVRELLGEMGVGIVPQTSGVYVDLTTGDASEHMPSLRNIPLRRIQAKEQQMAATMLHYRRLFSPGFSHLADELCVPFSQFCKARGLETVAKTIEPWFTGFGYGYLDEIPAAYVLKYASLFGPLFEIPDSGYQGLWECIARRLNVRHGIAIRSVSRGDKVVVVKSDMEQWCFDALVIACPFDEALNFLDASDEEHALFTQLRWNDYRAVVVSVTNFNDARYLFFPQHFTPDTRGRLMFAYKRWVDSNLRLFYAFAMPSSSPEETAEEVKRTVRNLGGNVIQVHRIHSWRYFPHVTETEIKAGFYNQLESLQGQKRTYYIGEALAMGTVETVVAYSRAMVARYFTVSAL